MQLAAARQERDDAVADAQPRATGAGSRAGQAGPDAAWAQDAAEPARADHA